MADRFRRGEQAVEEGARRIALEQIDRVVQDTEQGQPDPPVHVIRKCCKVLRGARLYAKPPRLIAAAA